MFAKVEESNILFLDCVALFILRYSTKSWRDQYTEDTKSNKVGLSLKKVFSTKLIYDLSKVQNTATIGN